MAGLNKMFNNMVNGSVKLVEDNCMELGGVWNWLTTCHDRWNTINMDGPPGSSLKLTTKEMHAYIFVAVPENNNVSHGAKDVGDIFQSVLIPTLWLLSPSLPLPPQHYHFLSNFSLYSIIHHGGRATLVHTSSFYGW